jgi:glycine/D-amino acid oxidase-like deaminating enzyme
MDESNPARKQGPPRVVIFGAGITGLTAAHELVERG